MLHNRCDKAIEDHWLTSFPIICSIADTVQVDVTEARVMAPQERQKREKISKKLVKNAPEEIRSGLWLPVWFNFMVLLL